MRLKALPPLRVASSPSAAPGLDAGGSRASNAWLSAFTMYVQPKRSRIPPRADWSSGTRPKRSSPMNWIPGDMNPVKSEARPNPEEEI